MAKIIKRYQLLQDFQLMTFFLVNGKAISVTFQNGIRRPVLVRGRFSTSDPDLQAVMEADKEFNVQFKLEHTDEFPDEVQSEEGNPPANTGTDENQEGNPPANTGTDENQEGNPPANTGGADEGQVTDYPEITSVNQAKQKLIELFPDVKISTLKNRVDVLAKATEKKVSFSKIIVK
jgi:hypothetical protein